jgi:hypothetical protein
MPALTAVTTFSGDVEPEHRPKSAERTRVTVSADDVLDRVRAILDHLRPARPLGRGRDDPLDLARAPPRSEPGTIARSAQA